MALFQRETVWKNDFAVHIALIIIWETKGKLPLLRYFSFNILKKKGDKKHIISLDH